MIERRQRVAQCEDDDRPTNPVVDVLKLVRDLLTRTREGRRNLKAKEAHRLIALPPGQEPKHGLDRKQQVQQIMHRR